MEFVTNPVISLTNVRSAAAATDMAAARCTSFLPMFKDSIDVTSKRATNPDIMII